jgi:hypothetical protein
MKAGETNDDCSFHNLNLENEDISKILKHFRFAFYIFLFTLKKLSDRAGDKMENTGKPKAPPREQLK